MASNRKRKEPVNPVDSFRGQWGEGTSYAAGDSVFHEGALYRLPAGYSHGQEPPGGPWQVIAEGTPAPARY